MKGPSTELIHAGAVDREAAVPLTTPIYETTTFVFDSAAEVLDYNEGRSSKHLYSRYTNPTVVSAEAEDRGRGSGRGGADVFVGNGRDRDDPDGASEGG